MGVVRDQVTISNAAASQVFNTSMQWWLDTLDGWEETPSLDVVLVPNGSGAGAYFGATSRPTETAITAGGAILGASRAEAEALTRQLYALFPRNSEIIVERYGKRMYCRLYDKIESPLQTPRGFRWTAPLIALDPFKYAPTAVTAQAGLFAGTPYYAAFVAETFNKNFETDVSDWTAGASCAITWASGQNNIGAGGAMQLQRLSTTGNIFADMTPVTKGLAVVPGQVVTGRGTFKAAATSRSVFVILQFYTAAGAFISAASGTAVADATGSWTTVTCTATAPATAAWAVVQPNVVSAVASEIHYVDELSLDDYRTYNAASYYRTYTSAGLTPAYPEAASLTNVGDEETRRVTITLTGPLTAGDYAIVNETARDVLVPNVSLDTGRQLIIDNANRSATVDGVDVTDQMFGDWITLLPGANSLRLIGGTNNAVAHMDVAAYAAYR
jgi:hypothetical protein